MKNNTAMEELIEYINDYKVNLLDTKTQNVLRNVRNIAENLLEKEKRIIVEARATAPFIALSTDKKAYIEEAEQYFTNTFKKD